MSALAHVTYEQPLRVARQPHQCYECGGSIEVGETYMAFTASPRYDLNQTRNWLHAPFCRGCSKGSPEWDGAQEG